MRIHSLLCGAVLALLACMPASAGDGTFNGFYAGGGASYSAALTDTSLDVQGLGSVAAVDGLSAQGAGVFGTIGYDVQRSSFVFGVWADYTHELDDTDFTVTSSLVPATILETELENRWAIGGRLGYVVQPGAMVYVLAGYTEAYFSDLSSPALGGSIEFPDLKGYVLGAGTELELRDNLYLQAQYTFSNYDSESVQILGPVSANLDTDIHSVRAGLVYRFGAAPSLK